MSNHPERVADSAQLTEKQWRDIKKLLPAGSNHEWVRTELELIARDKSSPSALARELERRANISDRFNRELSEMDTIPRREAFSQFIQLQIERDWRLAECYR